ncbi:MAG: hypothetical protein HYZ75_16445 [Elusimicrobia bacterium]|nr:hypothetical protein [Elusimicrobiota bacterium]
MKHRKTALLVLAALAALALFQGRRGAETAPASLACAADSECGVLRHGCCQAQAVRIGDKRLATDGDDSGPTCAMVCPHFVPRCSNASCVVEDRGTF